MRQPFVLASPLHRRCTVTALSRRLFRGRYCIFFFFEQPSPSSTTPFVSPAPPRHCHFTVNEIVLAPLHLRLLRATITNIPLNAALHSACITATLPLYRWGRCSGAAAIERLCMCFESQFLIITYGYSMHVFRRHQIWCFRSYFTRINYWLGLLIAFIYWRK